MCAVHTVRREIEKPALAHKGLDTVAAWLVDNGYTEGYATFWNGNAMIEQVAMRFGFFAYARIVADLGTDAFAAHQVCMQFLNITFTVGDGIEVTLINGGQPVYYYMISVE